ncbi:cutinase family protein [Mycobacterium sp. OTB74]|uniref:cutinase family protein n=1 Tax=Mycobacterium sp. OTB74 TaxID=1853452 RepID=UPI0032AFFBA5
MRHSRINILIGAATVAIWALELGIAQPESLPAAHAADCPDTEVIFARGTTEAPGPGVVGDAFISALRNQMGPKSLDVYAVDYPATTDFPTAVDGIRDARNHILAMAASCPRTKIVLGGFSQGAAVMGFVTAGSIPDGIAMTDVPAPIPPDVTAHVAAVALFGKPSPRFMHAINDPSITVGPLYQPKTIDLCVPNDLVCDPHGSSFDAHNSYVGSGLITQAATFTKGQLQASWSADALGGPQPWSATNPAAHKPDNPTSATPVIGPGGNPDAAVHLPLTAQMLPGPPPPTPEAPPPQQ